MKKQNKIKNNVYIKWRILNKYKFRPYIRLNVELPFFSVYVGINNKSVERHIVEYLTLYVTLIKWKFEFALYDTAIRRELNKIAKG